MLGKRLSTYQSSASQICQDRRLKALQLYLKQHSKSQHTHSSKLKLSSCEFESLLNRINDLPPDERIRVERRLKERIEDCERQLEVCAGIKGTKRGEEGVRLGGGVAAALSSRGAVRKQLKSQFLREVHGIVQKFAVRKESMLKNSSRKGRVKTRRNGTVFAEAEESKGNLENKEPKPARPLNRSSVESCNTKSLYLPSIGQWKGTTLAELSGRVLDLVGRNIDVADSLLAKVHERSKIEEKRTKSRWQSTRCETLLPKRPNRRKWMSHENNVNTKNAAHSKSTFGKNNRPVPSDFMARVKVAGPSRQSETEVNVIKAPAKSPFKQVQQRVYDSFDSIATIFGSVSKQM